MLSFAVFLIDAEAHRESIFYEQWDQFPQGTIEEKKILDFQASLEILPYLHKSLKHYHPDARLVVLTDMKSQFPSAIDYRLIRYDLDPSKVVLSKIEAYAAFLEEANDSNVIFLDYDMIVQADLEFIFHWDFAVGITFWPDNVRDQILAGSFICVSQKHIEEARKFFQEIMGRIKNYEAKLQAWYGEQQAFMDYFKTRSIPIKKVIVKNSFKETFITVEGIPLLLLPAHLYNLTYSRGRYPQPPPRVIHFRGRRKLEMPGYFHKHFPDIG
jgi:hypothetical protein